MEHAQVVQFDASPLGRTKLWVKCLPRGLSGAAIAAFWAVASYAHADGCGIFVGLDRLTEQSAMPRRTLTRALAELEKRGVLSDDGFQTHPNGVRTRRRRINLDVLFGRTEPAAEACKPSSEECGQPDLPFDRASDGATEQAVAGPSKRAASGPQTADSTVVRTGRSSFQERVPVRSRKTDSHATSSRDVISRDLPGDQSVDLKPWEPDRIMRGWCRKHQLDADTVWRFMMEQTEGRLNGKPIPTRLVNRAFYATARAMIEGFEDRCQELEHLIDTYADDETRLAA